MRVLLLIYLRKFVVNASLRAMTLLCLFSAATNKQQRRRYCSNRQEQVWHWPQLFAN